MKIPKLISFLQQTQMPVMKKVCGNYSINYSLYFFFFNTNNIAFFNPRAPGYCIAWLNKSNGQLCITIPRGSGIKEGDIVSIEKEKIKTIVYTVVTADLFHYGHLRLLQKANELGDFHICGVLTEEAIKSYKEPPVASLTERKSIISDLRCVDMVMVQDNLDPTENLKKITEQFPI